MIGEELLKLHLREWVQRFERIIDEAADDQGFSWNQAKALIEEQAQQILLIDYMPSNLLENMQRRDVPLGPLLRTMRHFAMEFKNLLEEYQLPEYQALSARFEHDRDTLVIHFRIPEPTFDEYIERCRREGQHIPRDVDRLLREWRSVHPRV